MSHEKADFPNCSGPDKLALHRLHGANATSEQAVTAEEIDDGFVQKLFLDMCFDPAHNALHFQTCDHSPTLQAWMQHEPSGPCPYVDGQNLYASPVDEPANPINPLGGDSL